MFDIMSNENEGRGKLTLQNMRLRTICLARALQRPPVDKVEHDTVWQLLSILIWGIRRAEVAEVEAPDNALFIRL